MPKYERMSVITKRNGLWSGEMREAVNFSPMRLRPGNIHHDDAARAAGFKGGVVSGLIHNEQFTPLALEAFGPEWFERGRYSFYYRTPTYDRDLVRAFIREPQGRTDNVQVEAWSETPEGAHVAEGVVGMGDPGEPTPLRQRFDNSPPPLDIRIFADVRPGQSLGEARRRFPLMPPSPDGEGQIQRRENTTEPLEWYFVDSPWGRPVGNSLCIARLFRVAKPASGAEGGVGVAGGIEVRFVNGPVFVDHDYIVSGQILGATDSPKTENLWSELTLRDAESGIVIAEALMMSRKIKAVSPLYAGARN